MAQKIQQFTILFPATEDNIIVSAFNCVSISSLSSLNSSESDSPKSNLSPISAWYYSTSDLEMSCLLSSSSLELQPLKCSHGRLLICSYFSSSGAFLIRTESFLFCLTPAMDGSAASQALVCAQYVMQVIGPRPACRR